MGDLVRLSIAEATSLCVAACRATGAGEETARSIARASVDAEASGQTSVGLAHFVDYLDALAAGRIDGRAQPRLTRPAPAIILSDAGGGAAHTGFDAALSDLVSTARTFGIAMFAQKNAYTCGALGYFAGRLAEQGLVAVAATNGPALLAGAGSKKPVYCTNPLAFAAPTAQGAPLVIDQSSGSTAFVNIRKAAKAGTPIPDGWAIDAAGNPTTDPAQAIKGAMLAFGGNRGANIALMVEVLAAGLSGSNWSLDAPSFTSGSECPGSGLTVIAIAANLLDPDFETRLSSQLDRLGSEYDVHVPGAGKSVSRSRSAREGLSIPRAIYDRIAGTAESSPNFSF